MRLMQYRLELEEDEGYIISNAPPALGGGTISLEQLWGPGIKLSLEQSSPSDDKIFEQFKFSEDNWENPTFRACYQQALRGTTTDWKLVSVEVMFNYLSLEFASEKRHQELEEMANQDIDSPYYNERVDLSLDDGSYAKLRFEVERPDDSGPEIYQVEMSRQHTKVTEFIDRQRRVINFQPPVRNADKTHQWVRVSNYCG